MQIRLTCVPVSDPQLYIFQSWKLATFELIRDKTEGYFSSNTDVFQSQERIDEIPIFISWDSNSNLLSSVCKVVKRKLHFTLTPQYLVTITHICILNLVLIET